MRFAPILVALACPLILHAQANDPLAVTLPNGKVLHFQSDEQKAAFLAAKDRSTAGAPTPTPTPSSAGSSQPSPAGSGSASSDEPPAMSGKVNVSAPTFTADYYLLAPETWVGKSVTLSVAYLKPVNTAPRADGMHEFSAYTEGTMPGVRRRRPGGTMTILATADAATRIAVLCGSTFEYTGAGLKTTLIKGQFSLLTSAKGGAPRYGLTVTQ